MDTNEDPLAFGSLDPQQDNIFTFEPTYEDVLHHAPAVQIQQQPAQSHFAEDAAISSATSTAPGAASSNLAASTQQHSTELLVATSTPEPSQQHILDPFAASISTTPTLAPQPAASTAGAAPTTTPSSGGAPPSYPALMDLVSESTSPLRASNPRLQISVHSPSKVSNPSRIPGVEDTYVVYSVTTHTSLPSFPSNQLDVRRRFRDFVDLSDLLQVLHPGHFVPPRPSRKAIEGRRMQARFIEERRAGLDRFMNRLALHPVLGNSQALQVFLEAPGALKDSPAWQRLHPPSPGVITSTARLFKQVVGSEASVPSPSDVLHPASMGTDVLRVVRERVAQLQGALQHAPVGQQEAALREEGAKLEEVRRALSTLTSRASAWVARVSEEAACLEGLAKGLAVMAGFEEAQGYVPLGPASVAAEHAMKASKSLAKSAEHAARHLTPLHDQLAGLPHAQAALQQRERALLTSLTLEAQLAARRAKMTKMEITPGNNYAKVERVRSEVSQLEESLAAARGEAQRIAERNADDLRGLKAELVADLVGAARDLALGQVASHQEACKIWSEMATAITAPGH